MNDSLGHEGVHLHLHVHFPDAFAATVFSIDRKVDTIMTTNAEFAQELRALNGTLAEINTDQQALLDKVTALEGKITAGDMISQEVEDEFASLKAGMEAAAAKVPTPLDPAAPAAPAAPAVP